MVSEKTELTGIRSRGEAAFMRGYEDALKLPPAEQRISDAHTLKELGGQMIYGAVTSPDNNPTLQLRTEVGLSTAELAGRDLIIGPHVTSLDTGKPFVAPYAIALWELK